MTTCAREDASQIFTRGQQDSSDESLCQPTLAAVPPGPQPNHCQHLTQVLEQNENEFRLRGWHGARRAIRLVVALREDRSLHGPAGGSNRVSQSLEANSGMSS